MIRELTLGMYVLNQTPYITLDANYDRATVCSLPPAYMDTYIGHLLSNVDYMIKALWHGAYIPKEKRIKFSERWRMTLEVNQQGKSETRKSLIAEFMSSGEWLKSCGLVQPFLSVLAIQCSSSFVVRTSIHCFKVKSRADYCSSDVMWRKLSCFLMLLVLEYNLVSTARFWCLVVV